MTPNGIDQALQRLLSQSRDTPEFAVGFAHGVRARKSQRRKSAIKKFVMWAYCRNLAPACFVSAVFRLFKLEAV